MLHSDLLFSLHCYWPDLFALLLYNIINPLFSNSFFKFYPTIIWYYQIWSLTLALNHTLYDLSLLSDQLWYFYFDLSNLNWSLISDWTNLLWYVQYKIHFTFSSLSIAYLDLSIPLNLAVYVCMYPKNITFFSSSFLGHLMNISSILILVIRMFLRLP